MPRSRAAPAPASSARSASPRPRPAASSSPSSTHPAPTPQSYARSTPPVAAQQTAPAPAPVPHASAPPPAMAAPSGGGLMSGLFGMVAQGAAIGTGSAIAHRAVDSFMGPRETRVVHEHEGPAPAPVAPQASSIPAVDGPCAEHVKAFADCMSRTSDMAACQFYFDSMQQCKRMAA